MDFTKVRFFLHFNKDGIKMNTAPSPLKNGSATKKQELRPLQFTKWWKATIIAIFVCVFINTLLHMVIIQALNQLYARQKAIIDVYADIVATVSVDDTKNKSDNYEFLNRVAETKASLIEKIKKKTEDRAAGIKPDVRK